MYSKNKQAIIILHEIYGLNQFISDVCQKLKAGGLDVYCPNLLNRSAFDYDQSEEAYKYFMQNVGFDSYKTVIKDYEYLKDTYEKVFILGFSAGATIAFRCSESSLFDGIIACYGSRIRDYVNIIPSCPSLLLFANEPSFDIATLISHMVAIPNVQIHYFNTSHAFLDPYGKTYDPQSAKQARILISEFLNTLSH